MKELTNLPNIGNTLAQKLLMIGVKNENDLKAMGSVNASNKNSTLENSGACINMLCAIEGAIK